MCSDAGPAPTPDPLIGQASRDMSAVASRQEDRLARDSAANSARYDRLLPMLEEAYRSQSGMTASQQRIADTNQSRVETLAWPIERSLAADAMGYYDADPETAARLEALQRKTALGSFDIEGRRTALLRERDAYTAEKAAHEARLAALPAVDREAIRAQLGSQYTTSTPGSAGSGGGFSWANDPSNPGRTGSAISVAPTAGRSSADSLALESAVAARVRDAEALKAGTIGPTARNFDSELAELERAYRGYSSGVDDEIAMMQLYRDTGLNEQNAAARDAGSAISSQFAGANRSARAEMARAGFSPDSGAYAGLTSEREAMEAAASASAMTTARAAAKQLGWSKRMDAAGLSRGWSGNQTAAASGALQASTAATNTALTPNNIQAQNQTLANQGTQSAIAGYGAAGNLALGGYTGAVGAWSAAQQAAAAESAGWGQALGMVGGAAMNKWGG